MKKRSLALAALALLAGAAAPLAQAETWPAKPIKMVVPFPPGGSTDAVARMVAQGLTDSLGVTIVVENKPGAGGSIGANTVATSKADGYTIGIATSSTHPAAVVLQKNLPYDPVKDFAPVTQVGSTAFIMVGGSANGTPDLRAFVAKAKAAPGEVPFANVGTSTLGYLLTLQLEKLTGTKFLHVTFRGSSQAYPELMAGRVAALFDNPGTSTELVRSGKLVNYGVTLPTQSLPEATLLNKSGVAGLESFNTEFWYGVVAPAGTPADIVNKLQQGLRTWSQSAEGKAAFARLSLTPVVSAPADFTRKIADDAAHFRKLAAELNVSPQ